MKWPRQGEGKEGIVTIRVEAEVAKEEAQFKSFDCRQMEKIPPRDESVWVRNHMNDRDKITSSIERENSPHIHM